MERPARRHHFLPQFYLAGFTNRGLKNDLFWAFDQQTGRQWEAKPQNVAYHKDLYRVDLPDTDPDAFEKGLAQFESKAASVVKNVINTQSIPVGDDYIILMNFIALLACRVPSRRDAFSEPMSEVMKKSLQLIFQYPERYQAYKQKMKEAGYDIDDDKVTYEQMKEFVNDESRYSIIFDNHTHLNNMMISLDAIIPLLIDRKWSVLLADDKIGNFICSDSPVNLHWTKPQKTFWGPGFGLKGTDVTVPLSKNVLLLGRFEEELPTQYLSQRSIAIMNSYTALDSQRYLYSCNKDFIWYMKNNRVGNTNDLVKMIKQKRQEVSES